MSSEDTTRPRIIDAHCHIASTDNIPQSFVDGAIANLKAGLVAQGIGVTSERLARMYAEKLEDPLCDTLVAEMERAGISKSILLVTDFTYALKDCSLTIEESFHKHHEVLKRHPGKFEVLAGVDPRWSSDGLTLFERALKEFGFRGLKVYPPCGFSPSDSALFPFYELCAAHCAPVVVHIGPTSPALEFNTSNPFLLDKAALLFPNVNFILAHGSVSFTEECAMMCTYRPNVFLDISGYQGSVRGAGSSGVVKTVVSRGINHKILFGTDWPVFRLQGDQQSFVEAILDDEGPLAELKRIERDLILHKTAERLFGV